MWEGTKRKTSWMCSRCGDRKSNSTNRHVKKILVYEYILLSFWLYWVSLLCPSPSCFIFLHWVFRHFVVKKVKEHLFFMLVVDTQFRENIVVICPECLVCLFLERVWLCFLHFNLVISCSCWIAQEQSGKQKRYNIFCPSLWTDVLFSPNLAQRECTVTARFSCKTRNLLRQHMAVV